jgi:hypothetical protein
MIPLVVPRSGRSSGAAYHGKVHAGVCGYRQSVAPEPICAAALASHLMICSCRNHPNVETDVRQASYLLGRKFACGTQTGTPSSE